ncbi:hypothetical protein Dimus_008340, partial [Dionaea muscipula]
RWRWEGWTAVATRPAVVAGGSMAVKWRLDVVGLRLDGDERLLGGDVPLSSFSIAAG